VVFNVKVDGKNQCRNGEIWKLDQSGQKLTANAACAVSSSYGERRGDNPCQDEIIGSAKSPSARGATTG
ncbi:MAG TPA: hypothetical protein VJ723_13980, partial [Candidatus Angelobacter sp.]|nr:hypothetical protein [Candidatus Angelobacter sp.]